MQSTRPTLTVSELNEYVRGMIENDRVLTSLYVSGEISNFINHRSGHFYFRLKDENASVAAVMFRSSAVKLRFMPENGMKVIAHCRTGVYTKEGQYQLYADSIVPLGAGSLALAFEQLKARLEAEGLFSPGHKKSLPAMPLVVGIITSPTGAAVQDIINIATRRFPCAKLVLYPAVVQGELAVPSLIDGIRFFSQTHYADVVIIGRGGGSLEDLWAFNSEALAREIYACEVPVISAVGHEIDFTICDFVADLRAPTPSAAAELALPDAAEIKKKLENDTHRMSELLLRSVAHKKEILSALSKSFVLKNPESITEPYHITLDRFSEKLDSTLWTYMALKKSNYDKSAVRLEALSPLAVLKRGYSAVFNRNGGVVKSVFDVNSGDVINIRTDDGDIMAEVISTEEAGGQVN